MSKQWILFLLIAVVVMSVCMGVIGGWLLPQYGFEGPLAKALPAALGGAIIAALYVKMIKGSNA